MKKMSLKEFREGQERLAKKIEKRESELFQLEDAIQSLREKHAEYFFRYIEDNQDLIKKDFVEYDSSLWRVENISINRNNDFVYTLRYTPRGAVWSGQKQVPNVPRNKIKQIGEERINYFINRKK